MDAESLLAYRREADLFFKSDPRSPLTPEQRATFASMDYFSPNPALEFVIEAEEFAEKPVVMLPVTGDKPPRVFQRWGRVHFTVEGQAVTLILLYSPDLDYFFLGFRDATSGSETYGGGRYIEPDRLADGRFHVDFNRAYNPYCAYNDSWSCVIPLPENRLQVRIEAGQKAFRA
jgi:uncharacterized protein (DUF1684 family)